MNAVVFARIESANSANSQISTRLDCGSFIGVAMSHVPINVPRDFWDSARSVLLSHLPQHPFRGGGVGHGAGHRDETDLSQARDNPLATPERVFSADPQTMTERDQCA